MPLLDAAARCPTGTGAGRVADRFPFHHAAHRRSPLTAHRRAFHYVNQLDMTMEISSTKRPRAGDLPQFYALNYKALFDFMMYPTTKAVQ
jgi:hypothetical protein